MKLSISNGMLRERYGDYTALKMIKEAGFDAVDYSMCDTTPKTEMLGDDYKEKAYKTKEWLNELGLICNQAHAPYSFKYADTLCLDNLNYLSLVRSIEYASIIGAKNLVVHYIKNDLPEDVYFEEYNLEFFRSFIPYLERYNIKISVENLYKHHKPTGIYRTLLCEPKRHLDFLQKLNSSYFNICVDTGHHAITGFDPAEAIRALGKGNVDVLHLHDIDYTGDTHAIPYTGKLDWNEIAKALADIDYQGDVSLEIVGYLKKIDDALVLPALKFMAETSKILAEKIKSYK